MLFVTVGMHTQPFDRLVRAADDLAALVEEQVIIQRGVSTYMPRFAEYVDFADETRFGEWMAAARVVISHGGIGSALEVLQAGKPLVIVPRMARHGEHIDDHQFELAEALAEQKWAVTVVELSAETLVRAVAQAAQLPAVTAGEIGLHAFLREWLAGWSTRLALKRSRSLRRRSG